VIELKTEENSGVQVLGEMEEGFEEILTADALAFVAKLVRRFAARRDQLLYDRMKRQERWKQGEQLDFLPETRSIREAEWTVAPLPPDLRDRRVEITGPAGDRKMVINALNSGATGFMADLEDALSPTWRNVVQSQINLRDAIDGTIRHVNEQGKEYRLGPKPAVLMVRPRGWHLDEWHVRVDGRPVPGGLFDFGLFFFHNASKLVAKGTGAYFYLPKLETHLEARLWNDVFSFAEDELRLPRGTIRATVLIETLPAAFEMDEILYELREHAAGLNCGRWDYLFSYLKTMRHRPDVILPDRAQLTMTAPFMRAYTSLAIRTCHRRGASCIGGMAAQIPVKHDPRLHEEAIAKVRQDKEREAGDGHDGTWVAHPGLVPVAKEVFDRLMPEPNQIHKKREEVRVTAEDLLRLPEGTITEKGLRTNIRVGILYLASWLAGVGAVAIDHLMEDAATAEISRAQVWQWLRHPKGVLDDGRKVNETLVRRLIEEERGRMEGAYGNVEEATELFSELVFEDEFAEFLTLPAYERLIKQTGKDEAK
jgi:malate synthase